MKQRILVAIIGVPALIGVLCFAPDWATAVLVAALCVIGCHEFMAAAAPEKAAHWWGLAATLAVFTVFTVYFSGGDFTGTAIHTIMVWLLAALIALIDALPVFGTGTVLAPWAAVECLLGNVPKGAALLALFAVISVVRSVLEPKLVAAQAGLPPLASLAAMYVGFCAAGVAGMVLAPVLLLLVKQLRDGGYIRLWR